MLYYIMKSLNVNEIIIDFIRKSLYDKRDVDFKNVKRTNKRKTSSVKVLAYDLSLNLLI